MKKSINLLLLLFVFTTTFLSGCSEEIYDEKNQTNRNLIIKEIKFEELLKDKKFKELLKKNVGFSENQRTAIEDQYGFTITEDIVKIIETDSVKSYTMHITRDSITDHNSFENLVEGFLSALIILLPGSFYSDSNISII